MENRIDHFCWEIRGKLKAVDGRMDGVKAKVEMKEEDAESCVRDHVAELQSRAKRDRAKLEAAKANAQTWVQDKKAAVADQIACWKAARASARLRDAASEAERYAAATLEIAMAAIDEAEQAALEAWLARQDADQASYA